MYAQHVPVPAPPGYKHSNTYDDGIIHAFFFKADSIFKYFEKHYIYVHILIYITLY